MALIKINDLSVNYRIPAGIQNDFVDATLWENDKLLLNEFFDNETRAFILNDMGNPPATTLINGSGGLFYKWVEVALPFYFSNTNFAIIGWNFDQKSYLAVHHASIFGNIELFRKQLDKVKNIYWHTFAKVIDVTQRLLELNKNSVAWLRVGTPILFDGNAAQVSEILSDTTIKIDNTFPLNLNETKNFLILYNLRKNKKI